MTSYKGEYIEYDSSPTVINQYTIGSVLPLTLNEVLRGTSLNGINGASSDSILAPDEIVLLASNDRNNWVVLDTATNLTQRWLQAGFAGLPHQLTISFNNETPYSYYRWVATRLAFQNFSSTNTLTSTTGIFCTELYARNSSNQTIVIFPEGVTTPSPVSGVFPLPNVTPNPPTGLVFIQVSDYPFIANQPYRNYTGSITTFLTPPPPTPAPTPSPTPEPTPAPTPSPTPAPSPTPGVSPTPMPSYTPPPPPGPTPTPMPSYTPPPTPFPTPTYPYETPTPFPTITPRPTSRPGNALLYIVVGLGVIVIIAIIVAIVLFLRKGKSNGKKA